MNVWQGLTVPCQAPAPPPAPDPIKVRKAPAQPKKLQAGDRRGEWTLLEYLPGSGAKGTPDRVPGRWRCRCSCGVERDVQASNITSGVSGSCGHTKRARKAAEWVARAS